MAPSIELWNGIDHQHGGFQHLLSCQSERPNCMGCCSMQRIDPPSWMTFKFKHALLLVKTGPISWIPFKTISNELPQPSFSVLRNLPVSPQCTALHCTKRRRKQGSGDPRSAPHRWVRGSWGWTFTWMAPKIYFLDESLDSKWTFKHETYFLCDFFCGWHSFQTNNEDFQQFRSLFVRYKRPRTEWIDCSQTLLGFLRQVVNETYAIVVFPVNIRPNKSRTWHFQPATARPNISNSCLGSIACSIMTCPCIRIKPYLAKCKTVESALFKYVCCKYLINKCITNTYDIIWQMHSYHFIFKCIRFCVRPPKLRLNHHPYVVWMAVLRPGDGRVLNCHLAPQLQRNDAGVQSCLGPSAPIGFSKFSCLKNLEPLVFQVSSLPKAPQKVFQKRGHQSHLQYLTINPNPQSENNIFSKPCLSCQGTQRPSCPVGFHMLRSSPSHGPGSSGPISEPKPHTRPSFSVISLPKNLKALKDSKKSGGYSQNLRKFEDSTCFT